MIPMDRTTMRGIEKELGSFLEYSFSGLGRIERRDALGYYVRGLLLDGDRKSMEPMAQRLAPEGKAEAFRQRMQQAVAVANWDERIVYRRVAERAYEMLPDIDAWALDDTGFPKKGRMSAGVQRQYSGTLGRIDNCQIAPSLHLAGEATGVCIGMRLYLPQKWTDAPHRRERGKIPDDVQFNEKWRICLDLIDDALSWGLNRRPVVADAGYGDVTEFRSELASRGLDYVLGVGKTLTVWPPGTQFAVPGEQEKRVGRPRTRPKPVGDATPLSVQALGSLPSTNFRKLTWREGTRGPQSSRFAFLRVRAAHKHKSGSAPGPEVTLIIEWPERAEKPTTFYLSNLPPRTSHRRLVYLAKVRWRIEQDYQEMKGELGLDHFEGRSWRGFNHHVACVAVAFAFLALHRALSPPRVRTADGPKVPAAPSTRDHPDDRALPSVRMRVPSSTKTADAHLIR
jgi:SRSO17 transposase